MIWHVYIIESKEGLHYTGMTTNLEKRSIWTKRGTDWKLIYKEVFSNSNEARCREKYFKNNAGKEWLKRQSIL